MNKCTVNVTGRTGLFIYLIQKNKNKNASMTGKLNIATDIDNRIVLNMS